MGGKGTIWAFDRDAKRLERLEANAETTGATNIVAQQVCIADPESLQGQGQHHCLTCSGSSGTVVILVRICLQHVHSTCMNMLRLGICFQADFLAVDLTSENFAEVRGVILDPSCSGSGTAHSRMDHLLPSQGKAPAEQQAARLHSLASFQVTCTSCA